MQEIMDGEGSARHVTTEVCSDLSEGLRRHHGRTVGRPKTSRMVTVTEPFSVTAGAGAA